MTKTKQPKDVWIIFESGSIAACNRAIHSSRKDARKHIDTFHSRCVPQRIVHYIPAPPKGAKKK